VKQVTAEPRRRDFDTGVVIATVAFFACFCSLSKSSRSGSRSVLKYFHVV